MQETNQNPFSNGTNDNSAHQNAARISLKVIGVGGAGNNAVELMLKDKYPNIEFIVANTDAQALTKNSCSKKIALGSKDSRGLGAGSDPDVGKKRANESSREIEDNLKGSDVVILTAGFGGGTGTGATPVIAQIAKNVGALTIAVITTPAKYEGKKKLNIALREIEVLKKSVDAYIVISNQKLDELFGEFPIEDAYKASNNSLKTTIIAIHDILYRTGKINIDYADVRKILDDSGLAVVALGTASGKDRAEKAINKAFANNLYTYNFQGAKRFLVNIQHDAKATGRDMSKAMDTIRQHLGVDEDDEDVDIIFGHETIPDVSEYFKVSIVAAGVDGKVTEQDNSNKVQPDFAATLNKEVEKIDVVETFRGFDVFEDNQEVERRARTYDKQATTSEINNYVNFEETQANENNEQKANDNKEKSGLWFDV
ncbi:cell division protein FtsZ [Mycoplasmopsis alligatoris]|uniref:Cell division protein FtsZ n=1 Tax=Mycoplasmopsis alligatoris A21JP2 TaxID=747682 RepID=D4XUX6_9BACT|nr:cell division protein FtsZ [Mycoplasmopsis alligatoris]EFF41843.1 cell division protein FtsZ [Mycoplasmopsis alligatoris A21JP2]